MSSIGRKYAFPFLPTGALKISWVNAIGLHNNTDGVSENSIDVRLHT